MAVNETMATRGLMVTLLRMAYGIVAYRRRAIRPRQSDSRIYIPEYRCLGICTPFYQTNYPLPGRTIAAAKFAGAFRRLIQSA